MKNNSWNDQYKHEISISEITIFNIYLKNYYFN